MKNRILVAMFLALTACTSTPPKAPESPGMPVTAKCEVKSETIKLCANGTCGGYRDLKLPATGKLVMESHLLTTEDPSSVSSGSDRIQAHLDRECSVLRGFGVTDCGKVHNANYLRVWTPAEQGKIGQGSISKRATPLEETFVCNLMWSKASHPKAGEKWLASFKGKNVVVAMGYETGPGDKTWLGGCQGAVHFFLGASNSSQVTLGRLVDQSAPIGPVVCN